MSNLINIYMDYKTDCLIQYGLVIYNKNNKFIKNVFRAYFKTYIDNYYYDTFNTIDDGSRANLKNLDKEFDGCMEELLYDYQDYELVVSNHEYSTNVSIIKELRDISYEVCRIDRLEYKDKDDIVNVVSLFVKDNKLINKLIEDRCLKLVSLIKKSYDKVNKVLNYKDEYFNITFKKFVGKDNYKYVELDYNIGILNNYRNGLVRKNYKNDEYDFFKFELIMKKISIDIIKNNGKKFDTLYFVNIKDSFVSRDKIINKVYELIDNPLIRKHVVFLVNYNTYLSHENAFSLDYLFGCIQDFSHINDIYKKTDNIYTLGMFNYLVVSDCKYKDRDYFLEYDKEGIEVLVFEEE